MSNWPTALLVEHADAVVPSRPGALKGLGLHPTLIEYLAPLYAVADGATYFDGAFRVMASETLVGWNTTGWEFDRDFAPAPARNTFWFLSNSFGDVLGVPVDDDGAVAGDVSVFLHVDDYDVEISEATWGEIMASALTGEHSIDVFLGRRRDHDWAKNFLGPVKPDECYSWSMPPRVGGAEEIDNIAVTPLDVHVSFTLQILQQALA